MAGLGVLAAILCVMCAWIACDGDRCACRTVVSRRTRPGAAGVPQVVCCSVAAWFAGEASNK
eukprot:7383419-Prymnesium_polylepis.1